MLAAIKAKQNARGDDDGKREAARKRATRGFAAPALPSVQSAVEAPPASGSLNFNMALKLKCKAIKMRTGRMPYGVIFCRMLLENVSGIREDANGVLTLATPTREGDLDLLRQARHLKRVSHELKQKVLYMKDREEFFLRCFELLHQNGAYLSLKEAVVQKGPEPDAE